MVNFHHTSYGQHLYEVPNFEKSSISETIQLLVENAQLKILNIYLSIQTLQSRKSRIRSSSNDHWSLMSFLNQRSFDPNANTHTNELFSYDPPYSRRNVDFFSQ